MGVRSGVVLRTDHSLPVPVCGEGLLYTWPTMAGTVAHHCERL
jgi:hypothetical protein